MVTENASAFRRILAWMIERYPPGILVLHALMYFAPISVAMALMGSGEILYSLPREALGPVVFYCFPLILRIMDEHKDYAQDCLAHPDRVLQSGVVTLKELRVVAYAAAGFQLACCLWIDNGLGPATLCWGIVIVYSVLMAKEFFCGKWLEQRMMAYAISHQAIMPMATFWVGAMVLSPQWPESTAFLYYCVLTLLCSFGYEISRKIKSPEDERDHVDTYTKALGLKTAVVLTLFLIAAQSAGAAWWLFSADIGATGRAWLIANMTITLLCLLPAILFMVRPKPKLAKLIEAGAALMVVWIYAWTLSAALSERDVIWM